MAGAQAAEQWSLDLADALSRVADSPGAGHELGLAQAYVRAGILDQGYEHFVAALRLNPRMSAAWDGKARIWRDWGFPHLGLGDAYRAVSADPPRRLHGTPSAQSFSTWEGVWMRESSSRTPPRSTLARLTRRTTSVTHG